MKSQLTTAALFLVLLPCGGHASPSDSSLSTELALLCSHRGCANRILERYASSAPTDERVMDWLYAVAALGDPLPDGGEARAVLARIAGDISSIGRFEAMARNAPTDARLWEALHDVVNATYLRQPLAARCTEAKLLARQLVESMALLGKLPQYSRGTTAYVAIFLWGDDSADQLIRETESCSTKVDIAYLAPSPKPTGEEGRSIQVQIEGRHDFSRPMILQLVPSRDSRPSLAQNHLRFEWDLSMSLVIFDCFRQPDPCVPGGRERFSGPAPQIVIEIEKNGGGWTATSSRIEMWLHRSD